MMALACVELGSFNASATARKLIPPSVSGVYIAPEIAYRFATSMNGIVPPGSKLLTSCWSDAVGVCSGLRSRSVVSTERKSRYWLVYVALRNVKVGVFGNASLEDEVVVCR